MRKCYFICPACKEPLKRKENCYVCSKGHSYDTAKQGYVHLVMPNKLHSKLPGDTKEMVDARRCFLEKDYYRIFRDALCDISKEYSPDAKVILDAGCGEAYYTSGLRNAYPKAEIYGIDISKAAVKAAAGKYKDIYFAVASIFDIPVESESADIITDVFAPIVDSEFLRILKPGGILILAVPGERHLWGLKEILYDKPYENEVKDTAYQGFSFIKRVSVKGEINTENREDMWNLFSMTPYYWKTEAKGAEKLKKTEKLSTEIHFDFLVYQKDGKS